MRKESPCATIIKCIGASSHSEKRASEWVKVYEAKNAARGSARERTVCTLQGVTQKGKCKEKRFEVLPEAKNRLADKAYSIPKCLSTGVPENLQKVIRQFKQTAPSVTKRRKKGVQEI